MFFVVMIAISVAMFNAIRNDLLNNSRKADIAEFCSKHDLVINPKKFRVLLMKKWVDSDPTAFEIELFRSGIMEMDKKYPIEPHLERCYLQLVKDTPDILRWLTMDEVFIHDPESPDDVSGLGLILQQIFDEDVQDEDDDGAGVVAEDFLQTIYNYMSWQGLKKDWFVMETKKRDYYDEEVTKSDLNKINMPHLIYQTSARNQVFNVLIHVLDDERNMLLRAYRMLLCGERLAEGEETTYNLSIPGTTRVTIGKEDKIAKSEAAVLPGLSMTALDYSDLVATLFRRYDLDNSGTLNTSCELQQLTFNLTFKISQTPYDVPVPGQDAIDQLLAQIGELNDENAWSVEDFSKWYRDAVLALSVSQG